MEDSRFSHSKSDENVSLRYPSGHRKPIQRSASEKQQSDSTVSSLLKSVKLPAEYFSSNANPRVAPPQQLWTYSPVLGHCRDRELVSSQSKLTKASSAKPSLHRLPSRLDWYEVESEPGADRKESPQSCLHRPQNNAASVPSLFRSSHQAHPASASEERAGIASQRDSAPSRLAPC